MAYETVNGYCWPQSVQAGERVALHVSSAGGRPVSVEVARVGRTREIVFTEHAVPADDHPTPTDAPEHGCGWPAASGIVVDADGVIRRGRVVEPPTSGSSHAGTLQLRHEREVRSG